MKTAFGYIGADSFTRQRQDAGQRPRGASGGARNGRRGR
jgi:23S rRNA pseudouridine2605 synthase